jgi:hypothetical protein
LDNNYVLGTPQSLGPRLLQIPDTTGDGVADYLVGVPEAFAGEGAMGVVRAPLPASIRVQDVVWSITAPMANTYGTIRSLGLGVMDTCDFNDDGRREVYVRAERSLATSEGTWTTTSIILFDSVTLSIVVEALDCPEQQQLWQLLDRTCRPQYLAMVANSLPFSFANSQIPICPTCLLQQSTNPSPGSQGSSNNQTSVGSGALQGAGSTGMVGRGLNSAVEIAADAKAYGQARGAGRAGLENAARHAYWQVFTAHQLGNDIAQALGDIHEQGQDAPSQPLHTRRDSWIDRYNNARARDIVAQCSGCTAQQLRDKLYDALFRDNIFIYDNCDPRIPDFFRDCDQDGIPAADDPCDVPKAPDAAGQVSYAQADVNQDGAVTVDDALQVMTAVGTQELENDVTGDCWIWIDDVNVVLEAVE